MNIFLFNKSLRCNDNTTLINQMINEITTNHYNNIVTDITKSEHKLSFIQIFKIC